MAWASLALFLTGAGGLLLELVWARALGWALGLSVGTQVLAVAAFVGGNGAGAALAGKWASSRGRPLAGARVLAGLAFLASLGVYPLLAWAGHPESPALLRTAGAALLPIFLAALVGGGVTPLVLAARADRGEAGRAGILLGGNLVGSLVGALAGGGWLIPFLGCRWTGWIGAGAYLAAGFLLFLVSDRAESLPGERGSRDLVEAGEGAPVRAVLPAAFLAGFAALGLETLLFRMLVLRTGAFSLSLAGVAGAFLLALGLGSLLLPGLLGRFAPGKAAAWLLLLAVLGCLAAPHLFVLLGGLLPWHRGGTPWTQAGLPLLYGLLVGGPAALALGGLFPLIYAGTSGSRPLVAGALTLAWSAGALAGAASTPLVLVPLSPGPDPFPWCGLALGALLIPGILPLPPRRFSLGVAAAGILLALLGAFPAAREGRVPPFERTSVAGPGRKVLETRHDAVTVATAVYDYQAHEKLLFTDGFQAASLGKKGGYMRLLAHLPLLLHPAPRRAVLVALGTGTTLQSLCLHEELERIDAVEISPAVVGLTRWFPGPGSSPPDPGLTFSFRGGDPRVRLHVQDGRLFLRELAARRIRGEGSGPDVITQEPLLPYTPAALPFYTLEFYRIVRKALAPGGVFAQWIPLGSTPPEMSRVLAATMARAFPWISLWVFDDSALLLGSDRPRMPSADRFRRAFLEAGVAEDLRRAGAVRGEDLLAGFVTDDRSRLGWPGREGLLRDDKPFLERFSRPSGREILGWFPRAFRWVSELRGKDGPSFLPPGLFRAQALYLQGRILWARETERLLSGGGGGSPGAGVAFLAALGSDPLHRASWTALREYRARRAALLGRSALAAGDAATAEARFRAALEFRPDDSWNRIFLAAALAALGHGGEAEKLLAEADWWWPGVLRTRLFGKALGGILEPLVRVLGRRLRLLRDGGTGKGALGPFRPKELVLFPGKGGGGLLDVLARAFPEDFTGALLEGLRAGGQARARALRVGARLADPFLAREVSLSFGAYSPGERILALPLLAGTAFWPGELLRRVARDPSSRVRAALAAALVRAGKRPEALEILLELLEDSSLRVRQAAALSVKVCLGGLEGYDPAGTPGERAAAVKALRRRAGRGK